MLHVAYRTDKEPTVVSLIEAACALAGRKGIPVKDDFPRRLPKEQLEPGDVQSIECDERPPHKQIDFSTLAVPEHSHPGESPSNGLAERSVQLWEDQFRTMKTALDSRLGIVLSNQHPVTAWLVEHAAYVLTKFLLGTDGHTGWGATTWQRTT